MGWASGSQLGEKVWDVVRGWVPPNQRQAVATEIYELFEAEDADDWDPESNLCRDADRWQDGDDF